MATPIPTEITALAPKPDAKFRVIGAGLPRSGTNSFCAAVSYVLDGPAYQAAIQSALSPKSNHVLALIDILRLRQKSTTEPRCREQLLAALKDEMSGFVASADAPLCLLVPEFLELYPDAIVICSVRDRDKWAKSMWKAAKLGNPKVLSWLYFWVPVLRYSPTMWATQNPIWREIYGRSFDSEEDVKLVWVRHQEWLREVVPPEKLFFVDLNDGWGPICNALKTPVPKDMPFPRLNDSEALEKTMGKLAVQGILRWVLLLVISVSTLAALWLFLGREHL